MAYIKIKKADVVFPIYNCKNRSIRNSTISMVGGNVRQDDYVNYVNALQDITLDFRDGDRVALLGHNGSGKSTLLKVMTGVYEPVSGHIETSGSIGSLADIAMGMDPESSGYDNIIMRCIFMGMTFKQAKQKIDEIVAFSELKDFIHLPMHTYSTGMYMRLAFSISTCLVPEIIIMDEMIGTGDKYFINKTKKRMQEFISKTKIMVIASHDISIIKELCNKAVLLEKGRVIADGDVHEVLQHYSATH